MINTAECKLDIDNVDILMDRYIKSRDIDVRNDLVMRYSYIAQTVAAQMRGITSNYAQMEDIVNQGIITLIDCVEKFDKSKGVKFETYAFMRIRGSVIDFIRKQDWLPRRVRKTAKDIAAAYDFLSNQLMRDPTPKEISEYLKITEEDLNRHYSEISNSVVLSFEGVIQNANQINTSIEANFSDTALPEDNIFKQELKSTLMEAIDSLSEKEKTVVSLYYNENLKLVEIANILNVSESRVCQIHSKAIIKLKSKMENYMRGEK